MKLIILFFFFAPFVFSETNKYVKPTTAINKDIFIYCLKHSGRASEGVIFLNHSYMDCLSKAKDFEKYCGSNQNDCFKNLWWNAKKKEEIEQRKKIKTKAIKSGT